MSASPSSSFHVLGPAPRPSRSRLPGLLVVAALHLAALWGLTRLPSGRAVLAPSPVLTVSLITPVPRSTPQPQAPAPPRMTPPTAPSLPVPAIERVEAPLQRALTTTPTPSMPTATPAAGMAEAAPTAASAVDTSAAPTAPVPAPAPAERQVQVSQVAYLSPPVLAYPLAARRLREQGLVQVKVRVDEQGRPERFAIERSSGHPALDDAALQTVRATRFQAYRENGVPMPFWVVMPLLFELDNS